VRVITGAVDRDFIRVGRSRIHGRGVFAKRKIPQGARIVEYTGARVPTHAVVAVLPEGGAAPVYAFQLDDATVIDGARGGSDARFVNHGCAPNCEALCFDGHVYFYALRDISRGEELTIDYRLATASSRGPTKRERDAYACRCGSPGCRGTMLVRSSSRSR
jgi:SET domain-containing protein